MPEPHESGTREAFRKVLSRHEVQNALLIQPSCYGVDNTAMLDAMAQRPGFYKGIAVVEPTIREKNLAKLSAAGVVGIRFNLVSVSPESQTLASWKSERLLAQIAELGWFVQVYADDAQWPEVAASLRRSGVRVLIDHFGVRDVAAGTGQPGFQAVLALGREGLGIIKLSAAFRLLCGPHGADVLDPFVASLVDAFGHDRCIWGSDWPFLGVAARPDYGETMTVLERWLTPAERERVVWHNPRSLFGFSV